MSELGLSSHVPLLEVENVDFRYGQVQVLFGVSLEVRKGEALALLGTNGAGKSTLLRVVTGLEHPVSGHVRLAGREVTSMPAHRRVSEGIVLVPGGRGIFPDMSVAENLEMATFLLRRTPAVAKERRDKVLELFPRLAERRRQQAGSMSGGEQQQLALAKAFVLEPALLCIDELSLGLAPVVVESLLAAVRVVMAEGTTVILVEQSLNVAASLCGRAVFLEKGEVRFEGPTDQLLERSDIARAVFFGERSMATAGGKG